MIKELKKDEIRQALELVNRVFSEFVAVDYSQQGRKSFNDYLKVKYDEVSNDVQTGHKKIWGLYLDDEIVGVIATRDVSHIALMFVDKRYHRKGIAKRLYHIAFSEAAKNTDVTHITVNSSPYAVKVYERLGFIKTGEQQELNGIIYVPMSHTVVRGSAVRTDTIIREINKTEYPLLDDFLYNALFIPEGAEFPAREVIYEPEIYIYVKDFGLENDCGVVAERNGVIIGAAWTRIIPAYGHLDDSTPELAISVLPDMRSQGVGAMLMRRLFDLLCERGYKRTSLSVQQDNPAVRFYKQLGYVITDEKLDHAGHGDYIMVKNLECGGIMENVE